MYIQKQISNQPPAAKFVLEFVVFSSGAVVMIFELIGSRVIAPYVGTSIYAWTSLIGIILASLSVGYYVGGYIADKRPHVQTLSFIILLASIGVAYSAFAKDIVALIITSSFNSLELKSILTTLILFSPASFFLGMVSPYAVRLKMNDISKAGKTAGSLYALSTAGSIVGTFLAGFFVIPNFGTTKSLLIISIVLLILSLLLVFGKKIDARTKIGVVALVFFFILTQGVLSAEKEMYLANVDTEYNKILVSENVDPKTEKLILTLKTDPYGIQSAVFKDNTDGLVFSYINFYNFFRFFVPEPQQVLMIGASAYAYPMYFTKHYPHTHADVVEIDPGMTEVALQYFNLDKQRENLKIHHEDGRIFLNENEKEYDVIFMDAFSSASSIPFHLTTKEAVGHLYNSLTKDGIVMSNIISSLEGPGATFLQAEYNTYKEYFTQVHIFAIRDVEEKEAAQNIMLVALKSSVTPVWNSEDAEIKEFLTRRVEIQTNETAPVLTDNYAPVEHYRKVLIP